jgi:hypothetical protein
VNNDPILDSIEWLRTSLMCELAPEEVQAAREVSSEALVKWEAICSVMRELKTSQPDSFYRDYLIAELCTYLEEEK